MLGATPMLALLIITGSSMAFTAIAGRMGGQDHFNEKNIQPDALNVGALNAVAPYANTNIGQGTRLTGTESFTPVLDISAAQSAAASMSYAQMTEASNTASRNLLSTQSDAASQMLQASTLRNTAAQLKSSDIDAYQAASSFARKMGWGSGKDGAVTEEDVGKAATWMSAGFKLPFLELGAGAKGELENSAGIKMSYNTKESISKEEAASFNRVNTASMEKAVSAGFSKTLATTDSKTLSAINSTTLGKNISESVKATETYTKTHNASSSMGSDRKIQADTFANAIKPYLENGGNNFVRSAYQDALNDQSIPQERRDALRRSAELHTKFHGGDAVMGMAIAYTDFAMKKDNNRMGDAQVMLRAAGISDFVGQNDYKFTPKTLEKVGSVDGVGYHGPNNVRSTVDNNIAGTSAEVKGATADAEKLYGNTGGNPTTHHGQTKPQVEARNAKNQRAILNKQFDSVANVLRNANTPTGATALRNGPYRSANEWMPEVEKALPKGTAEGVKKYIRENGELSSQKFSRGVSMVTFHNIGSPEDRQKQIAELLDQRAKALNAESEMYQDVVDVVKLRHGDDKNFSEEKYRDEIDDMYNGIKNIVGTGATGYSEASITAITNVFKVGSEYKSLNNSGKQGKR